MFNKENSLIFEGYQRNVRKMLVTEKHKPGCTCKFCEMIKSKKGKGKGKKDGKKDGKEGKRGNPFKKGKKDTKKNKINEDVDTPVTSTPTKRTPDEVLKSDKPFWDEGEMSEIEGAVDASFDSIELTPEQMEGAKKLASAFIEKKAQEEEWGEAEKASAIKDIEAAKNGLELSKILFVQGGGEGVDVMPDEFWGKDKEDLSGDIEPEAGAPVPPAATAGTSEMPRG